MTSSQNDGTVLQCGLLALLMARACNSEAMSCAVWPVIIPFRPLSPLSTARSSSSDMPFMSSMRSRTGIMCDMSGISISDGARIVSSNVKCTPSGVLIGYSDWRTIQTSVCNLLTAMSAAKSYPPITAPPAPADSPKLLDRVRDRIRRKGYSIRTEKYYAHWI